MKIPGMVVVAPKFKKIEKKDATTSLTVPDNSKCSKPETKNGDIFYFVNGRMVTKAEKEAHDKAELDAFYNDVDEPKTTLLPKEEAKKAAITSNGSIADIIREKDALQAIEIGIRIGKALDDVAEGIEKGYKNFQVMGIRQALAGLKELAELSCLDPLVSKKILGASEHVKVSGGSSTQSNSNSPSPLYDPHYWPGDGC